MMTKYRPHILIITAALLICGLAAWWLAGQTPTWYMPPPSNDPAAITMGETAEYRLVEEFQKIRPADAVWRLRIPEDAINAWLATRLPRWLKGQGGTWPTGVGTPQVHITTSGLHISMPHPALGGRIGTLRVRPAVIDNQILCAVSAGVGRLPIAIPATGLNLSNGDASDPTDPLHDLEQLLQGDRVAALIPLVDRRIVTIHDIDLEDGSVVIAATTSLPTP